METFPLPMNSPILYSSFKVRKDNLPGSDWEINKIYLLGMINTRPKSEETPRFSRLGQGMLCLDINT